MVFKCKCLIFSISNTVCENGGEGGAVPQNPYVGEGGGGGKPLRNVAARVLGVSEVLGPS